MSSVINSPLPDLCATFGAASPYTHLSFTRLEKMFSRSRASLQKDCQFLQIDTSKRGHGGSISECDAWVLYLYYCWVTIKRADRRWFRKDDYWADVSPSDVDGPSIETSIDDLRLSFMYQIGGSEADFDRRWAEQLRKSNQKFITGQNYGRQIGINEVS